MKIATLACLAAFSLAAAACSEKKAAQGETAPSGEVLPGSASDAMVPYDTVRSQPPLAPQTNEPASLGGVDARSSDAAEAAEAAGAAASDAAAPAVQPKPQPSASAQP